MYFSNQNDRCVLFVFRKSFVSRDVFFTIAKGKGEGERESLASSTLKEPVIFIYI